jgi:diaminopimelate epimerase
MRFDFHKYHGTGNDFIMINDQSSDFPAEDHEGIRKLCERRFGIGGDGLILIRKDAVADFRMLYFNSDGREGSMCGNGGRCAAAFAFSLGICGDATTFLASDGPHVAKILGPDRIQLKMKSVDHVRVQRRHFEIDTGSPHYVSFVDALEAMDVYKAGRKIRLSNAFKAEGINVNFVEQGPEGLYVRTYERGVENETYSCGTGVVASALCAFLKDSSGSPEYRVKTRGGELKVSFRLEKENKFRNIILEGPARFVYQGSLEI